MGSCWQGLLRAITLSQEQLPHMATAWSCPGAGFRHLWALKICGFPQFLMNNDWSLPVLRGILKREV